MPENKWAHLGHTLGECWTDVDKSITYVNIPKNASSFIKTCLLESQKFTHHQSIPESYRYIIALRDPIDRWCSGVAQYLCNNKQNLYTDEILNNFTFDDHTELQTYFIEDVDLNKCQFFYVDKNLRSNIQNWLNENDYTSHTDNIPNINEGDQFLKGRLATMIDSNSQIKLKLLKHYEQDYALINRVKFYGT